MPGMAYQTLLPADARIPTTYCRNDLVPPGTAKDGVDLCSITI